MTRACQAPRCGRPLPPGRRRFCSDICRLRGQRSERRYDSGECGEAAIRMIMAVARRAGTSDVAEFGVLWEIRQVADRACADAIDSLRAKAIPWAEIAAEAGVTRQALCQWRHRRLGRPDVNESFTPEAGS